MKELTDLTYIELPDVGKSFEKGGTFGVVESVKAASDLYLPIDGEVIEINESLEDELEVLSEDAFGAGWMIKVKMSNPEQVNEMMDHAAYEAFCQG